MDVVPVFPEYWNHPPFAAEIDEDGKIFARGTQDTKQLGMQYLAAIRALKRNGIKQLKRTIHVLFVPNEEQQGKYGMRGFVVTSEFKALNAAFALDEGNNSDDNKIPVLVNERSQWTIEFIIEGQSGHGSRLFNNTPGQKFNYLLNKLYELREIEAKKYAESKNFENITSINLTIMKGGIQTNVIPPVLSATFDMRLAINLDHDEFEQQVNKYLSYSCDR